MWTNNSIYQGSLAEYHYPTDKEVGDLLGFLKKIKSKKRIFLLDVPRWNLPLPSTDYDIYIICMFGEAVNEDYVNALDQHAEFIDKQIILLTSQYYTNSTLGRVKVFYIEHLHTVRQFLPRPVYTQISNRQFTHGALSHRNSVHKTILIAKLLQTFDTDLQYTFCNSASNEYTEVSDIVEIMTNLKLGLDKKFEHTLRFIHNNPVMISGHLWDVNNRIYHDSKLIWTAETNFISGHGPSAYITEKTMKSIVTGSPFVIMAQQNTLARLRSMGFETYEKEFKIDYDNKCDVDRYLSIFDLIDQFDLTSVLDSQATQDIADYNHNYFYADFYSRVEQDNVDRIEHVVDYVNAI